MEQNKVHQMPQQKINNDKINLTPELVAIWLGEKEMQIKVNEILIKRLTEENKTLKQALTEKQG